VATPPTPASRADRAHPVGVMCRERGRGTLWLLEVGSEGVFPGLVATDHPRDGGMVQKGETAATKAVPGRLPWALAFVGTGVLRRQTLREFPAG
jgi:hypothetical protein